MAQKLLREAIQSLPFTKGPRPRRKPGPGRKPPKQPKRRKPPRVPKKRRGGFNAPALGAKLGSYFGPTGKTIGGMAGNLFRQITGFGDYKVSKNSLIGSMDQLPSFRNMSSGTRIQHREYLFDVITSVTPGAFSIEKVPIQPALLEAFPWLSASAENYQEYQLNGVVYEFKSNSYDALASTNTASGTVVMATDYNVLDPPFVNKFQMEQTQFTCSGKPSINLLHPIECNKLETPTNVLYTRPGPVTTGDLRLYDWGNFYIATVGMQGSSTNIGELWVTYDITLLKPKLNSTVDVYDHYLLNPTSSDSGGPNYFGTTGSPPTLTTDSDLGTNLESADGTNLDIIAFPVGYTGKVMVVYRIGATTTSAVGLMANHSLVFDGGVTLINGFGGGIAFTNEYVNGVQTMTYNTTGGMTLVFFLNVSNGGRVGITNGTTGTVSIVQNGDLYVVALPTNFATSPMVPPSLVETKLRTTTDITETTDDCHFPSPSPTPSEMKTKSQPIVPLTTPSRRKTLTLS
jgi:hypothetical protein